GDDGIGTLAHEAFEELLGLAKVVLERALLGDVAEGQNGRAVLTEERRDRDRQRARLAALGGDGEIEGAGGRGSGGGEEGELARASRTRSRSWSGRPTTSPRREPRSRSPAGLRNRTLPSVSTAAMPSEACSQNSS